MPPALEKAFDFAQDSTKQLIALATGTIALSITFAKDFAPANADAAQGWAIASWACLLTSMFFGLWTLLALTGELDPSSASTPSIRGSNVVLPSIVQIAAFLVGMVLIVVYGAKAL